MTVRQNCSKLFKYVNHFSFMTCFKHYMTVHVYCNFTNHLPIFLIFNSNRFFKYRMHESKYNVTNGISVVTILSINNVLSYQK